MESLRTASKAQNPSFLPVSAPVATSPDYSRFHQNSIESAQAQKSPLGIHTNYPSTAEKTKVEPTPTQLKNRQKYKRLKTAAKLLPNERIASCQHTIAPEYQYATVAFNPANSATRFKGLYCCDSSSCPHCVAARSEADRHELTVALSVAKKREWTVFMVTLTLQHLTHDALLDLQALLTRAFDRCFSGRFYQGMKDEYGIKGKIKGWEVTYGKNGFHPHLHILFFSELKISSVQLAGLETWLGGRWLETLKKLGGSASLQYGISIEAADSKIAEYIAKWGHEPSETSWGIESEITKGHLKKARDESGLTMFELLGAAGGEADSVERLQRIFPALEREALVARAGQLYVEYFRAFKGKPRLHWGNLKNLLELDEALRQLSESETEVEDETFEIVMIERGAEWVKVTGGYKGADRRAELLEVCSTGNPFEVQRWLKQHDITAVIPDLAWERFNALEGRAWQSPGDDWEPVAGGRLID